MRRTKIAAAAAAAMLAAGCFGTALYAEESAAEAVQSEESAQEETKAASEQVASAEEMTTKTEVVSEDMTAVYADALKEGTYPIEVLSSSSMFKITECTLTVADGELSAVMTLSGDGYLKLYMGTGLEAVEASEEDYIPFELNEDGKQTYTVPVEALDLGIDCAAWSKKKEKWYDRTLVFSASSLPQDAFAEGTITTVQELGLADGTYTVEVKLEGGSGKNSVESPTQLTVKDGTAAALITFGSPNYDYVLIGEEKYLPVNTEGNSAFELPVGGFDWKMPITADTVAMSTPHEIDYTLYFDSASIQEAQ